MRAFLFASILMVSFQGVSLNHPADTSSRGFFKQISFQLNWFEIGGAITFNQKKLSRLENGLNHYYNNSGGHTIGGIPGFTFYYKNKFGLGLMLNNQEFYNGSRDYLDYLTATHLNYYIPSDPQDYSYRSTGLSINLSYRKRFKQLILEPKLRATLGGTLSPDSLMLWLKEKGSNQFKQLDLVEERKPYLNSYHAMIALIYQFKNKRIPFKWQIGVQADFFITPMKSSITLSEYYSVTNTRSSVKYDISRLNPALGFSFFVNWKFGEGKLK